MRRICACILSVVAFGSLLASPASAVPIIVDHVDSSGLEWASLVDTGNVSWNQLNAACSTDGLTACTGNIGSVETAGWIWATRDQVRDLFYDLGVPLGELDDYYAETEPGFAPFVTSVFSPSASYSWVDQSAGWTATLESVDVGVHGIVTNFFDPALNDWAHLASYGHVDNADPDIGAWLFRNAPASSVPEPASLLLLGVGLVGLARQYRRPRT